MYFGSLQRGISPAERKTQEPALLREASGARVHARSVVAVVSRPSLLSGLLRVGAGRHSRESTAARRARPGVHLQHEPKPAPDARGGRRSSYFRPHRAVASSFTRYDRRPLGCATHYLVPPDPLSFDVALYRNLVWTPAYFLSQGRLAAVQIAVGHPDSSGLQASTTSQATLHRRPARRRSAGRERFSNNWSALNASEPNLMMDASTIRAVMTLRSSRQQSLYERVCYRYLRLAASDMGELLAFDEPKVAR